MKHFEFWPARAFEAPYFLYLMAGALVRRLPFKFLAKANYALDHGELGFGSKFHTQQQFPQTAFLPTEVLTGGTYARQQQARHFAEQHGLPVILKPDRGRVGKGIIKVDSLPALDQQVLDLHQDYLIQQFTPHPVEFGVFFVRQQGQGRITGINQKHFPQVIGDGSRTLQALAEAHPRYTPSWKAFLGAHDLARVPQTDEIVRLSFIGSHTLGCLFTNDTQKLTSEISDAVNLICQDQPGFNFGRLDVKAASEAAFHAGEFVVIEINGIASLPTHMFDPKHSVREGYRIFFEHGRYLLDCANEHRDTAMALDSWREILSRLRHAEQNLEQAHRRLADEPPASRH